MKDEASAEIWKQLLTDFSETLKPYGFVKAKLCFTDRTIPDVIRQVSIEKFRWNLPDRQQFNLILSLHLATGKEGEFSFKGHTAGYSLVFRKGLGYFLGDETSLFLLPNTLSDQVPITDLHRHVTNFLLPVLERCISRDAVIDFVEEENQKTGGHFFSAGLAIALARLGRIEESKRHFRQCPGDPATIAQMAERYGIDLKN